MGLVTDRRPFLLSFLNILQLKGFATPRQLILIYYRPVGRYLRPVGLSKPTTLFGMTTASFIFLEDA
jgi:hypothetical protein